MTWRLGMAAALAAASSMSVVPAAMAHGGAHPEPGEGGSSSADHADEADHADQPPKAVSYEIVQGDFFPMAGHEGAFGAAKLGLAKKETRLWVHLGGLAPEALYAVHLHEGSCSAPGGHYKDNAKGEAAPPNELWASTDAADPEAGVTSDADGSAVAEGVSAWKARRSARAVMLHDPDGAMVACADLT